MMRSLLSFALIFATFHTITGAGRFPDSSCLRFGVHRGNGVDLTARCGADEDVWERQCYPKCKETFEPINCCECRKIGCPLNMTTSSNGEYCDKPPAVQRVPFDWQQGDPHSVTAQLERCQLFFGKDSCERYGDRIFQKCKPGWHLDGCCSCVLDCPTDMHDGISNCRKQKYMRSSLGYRLGCEPGFEEYRGRCWIKCPDGYIGEDRNCWQKCPENATFDCGIFCSTDLNHCEAIKSMVRNQYRDYDDGVKPDTIGTTHGWAYLAVRRLAKEVEYCKGH